MSNVHKGVVFAALLVLVVSITSLFRKTNSAPYQEQLELELQVKELQVFRVCESVPPDAPIALLAFDSQLEEPDFKSMVRKLKEKGLAIQHIHGITITDEALLEEREGFPYEDFLRVAEEHPAVKGIVSLCGTPYWPKTETVPDPASLPPLLVINESEFPDRIDDMLNGGLVAVALAPREDPDMEIATTDPAQLFDRDYLILSAPSP